MPTRERDREVAQVELDEVSKHFGGVRALDRVSLAVARGSVHALVGENGAGKSTLGRIVAGVLRGGGGGWRSAGAPAPFASPGGAPGSGTARSCRSRRPARRSSVRRTV